MYRSLIYNDSLHKSGEKENEDIKLFCIQCESKRLVRGIDSQNYSTEILAIAKITCFHEAVLGSFNDYAQYLRNQLLFVSFLLDSWL